MQGASQAAPPHSENGSTGGGLPRLALEPCGGTDCVGGGCERSEPATERLSSSSPSTRWAAGLDVSAATLTCKAAISSTLACQEGILLGNLFIAGLP